MPTIISKGPEDTAALGEAWAREATAGWVLGLSGDLGAGKTQFVKGFARGLGYSGRVQSPTFALVNEYTGGRIPLFHLDLYRLDTREQIIGAGLEDYLYRPHGVAIIEWIERWIGTEPTIPAGHARLVRFKVLGENKRQIDYEDFGH
ncbi:MAG: tRNA ((37)-N6)-threonylcarbamoyltransferase complex ATPase subunit type 1 TsaE [Verrucomicrobiales bacterium]|nr:tRNA ((37)-N6)-threonylcarbamoyltransferase complex ATPase subunit type 1 TsaE [Verrucomicrobiales bacterium]